MASVTFFKTGENSIVSSKKIQFFLHVGTYHSLTSVSVVAVVVRAELVTHLPSHVESTGYCTSTDFRMQILKPLCDLQTDVVFRWLYSATGVLGQSIRASHLMGLSECLRSTCNMCKYVIKM